MKTGRILKSAFKGLGKNKLRTFFMMIGIVIGITAVTIVISAGLGAQNKIMERVKKFGLESLMIFAGGGREMGQPTSGGPITTLKIEDAEALKREIGNIAGVAPFNRKGDGVVKHQEKSITTRIFGVTPAWAPVWDWYAAQGEFITDEDEARMARVCVIGPTVQQELFGGANPIGEQIRIGNVIFEIKGIMQPRGISPGGGDMDNRVYTPLSTFMRRVANVDYIFGIKVLLKDARKIDETVVTIKSILRERHKLAAGEPDDFRITTPTEVTQFAEKVVGTFNIFLVLVAGISLIAGGFVIANIMLISVSERRGEIGLRKALGARNRDIRFQFLLETLVVTITGGIIGILLGFIGSTILGAVTQLPVSISWEGVMLGILFSSLVGFIAGLQPAKRAAALQPIEALRS
ncbi:MAG TPA: FtsX-like permease family protein [bacterium]|nr:FtsX-like permease family protein [bacterium]